jgi:hypothetical protein
VTVPEINGPGDNSVAGGVSRIDPVSNTVLSTAVIPIASCSGPQGLAIGPVVGGQGTMLQGCNGANTNAAANRPTSVIADGSAAPFGGPGNGALANVIFTLPFQAGNDMVDFNASNNHYYLARSGNNSQVNPAGNGSPTMTCPASTQAGPYGSNIYNSAGVQAPSLGPQGFAGPQVIGTVDALTGVSDGDTVTGLGNCPPLNPHGTNHSVASDSAHGQVYVPIASNAQNAGTPGPCSAGGGSDANGCIAVYVRSGTDTDGD